MIVNKIKAIWWRAVKEMKKRKTKPIANFLMIDF